jgi:4-amino-4-deoxy-L-arabinose transferase-like glycosyltransferase
LLAIAVLALLAGLVISRRGNLAWDDADYLRRGLSNARFAAGAGPLYTLPRALDRLLMEQPKPPWFVAWIELGVHAIGRRNIDLLILFATVLPYALLIAVVTLVGRWLRGPWGGFLSLVCLAASPLSLAFGAKVMVETFLALWVLLVYSLTARYLTAPSKKIAAALGVAVALALLTKLTTVLFLPGPLIYGFARMTRNGVSRAFVFKRLTLCALVCLALAGPWYWKNAGPAVRFAFFSSKYNEVATGRDRVPAARRAVEMARDLAGPPLIGTIAAGTLAVALLGRRKQPETTKDSDRQALAQTCFARMAWLGAGIAAAVLLYPAYFDTRFLLPIWPVLAVAIGSSVHLSAIRLPAVPKTVLGPGFAGSLVLASLAVAREPLFATYWETTAFIDDLVKRYGVSNLMNVGNCAAWNVCKTGLMNELRHEPGNCFVLHDLTRAPEARAKLLLKQADAVVVLGRSDLSDAVMQVAPGLNRGYGGAVQTLKQDPAFRQVPFSASDGLPELLVFVRQARIDQAREMAKSETRRRR